MPRSVPQRTGIASQTAQILTAPGRFVPTAFELLSAEGSPPSVDWQSAIKRAIRSSSRLREILGLQPAPCELQAEGSFPTFVPWEFLRRMRKGDPDDPLLRQVLPQREEDERPAGFTSDPVDDLGSLAAGGLLHKYHGRALVITTGACGVHCRYCFRRDFPYTEVGSRWQNWRPTIDYLRGRDEIDEVLLSGGDPLTLTDGTLSELVSAIESIPHVRRLRIHTRMPIVIPQRVTEPLLTRLRSSRLAVWLVVHANHPNELDADVIERLARVVDYGIPVLNQSVLLRGVNDDAATLIELCRRLVDHRVQPYYLHQLDRVQGASHFEVPVSEGGLLMDQLRAALPGYAVPNYVVEQAGRPSKTPLSG
jgi:EF-P beta-lysylation protein EpmB